MNILEKLSIALMVVGAAGMIGVLLVNLLPIRSPAKPVNRPTATGPCERCRHGAIAIQHPMIACHLLGRLKDPAETCSNWG